jgi:hypothetical protein
MISANSCVPSATTVDTQHKPATPKRAAPAWLRRSPMPGAMSIVGITSPVDPLTSAVQGYSTSSFLPNCPVGQGT